MLLTKSSHIVAALAYRVSLSMSTPFSSVANHHSSHSSSTIANDYEPHHHLLVNLQQHLPLSYDLIDPSPLLSIMHLRKCFSNRHTSLIPLLSSSLTPFPLSSRAPMYFWKRFDNRNLSSFQAIVKTYFPSPYEQQQSNLSLELFEWQQPLSVLFQMWVIRVPNPLLFPLRSLVMNVSIANSIKRFCSIL